MAGAGGFEPPHGGIKIRCLTTWLRPTGTNGKLSGKLVCGNKTACSAPPAGFGGGERIPRAFGRAAIGEESKAGGAAAAHSREKYTRQPAEAGEHHADLRHEADRRLGQIVVPPHEGFRQPSGIRRHRIEPRGVAVGTASRFEYGGGRQLTARI